MPKQRQYCDFCNSNNLLIKYKDVADYESFIKIKTDVLVCKNCDLIQQSYIFSKDEIKNFYLENYHGRNYGDKNILKKISSILRSKYYKRFIKLLKAQTKKKDLKILDYGSGDGFLCYELKKAGYKNLYSCDFFKPTVINSTKHIIPEKISEYYHFFDVIFMINSIEHLTSFSDQFNIIDSSSKDSSILIIETPNFNSLDSKIFKKFWGGLHQPRHTYLWTEKSLLEHLSLWKYKSKSLKTPQPAHWAISIQNILSNKFKLFRKYIINGRIPGYLILVILFLPFALVQNFSNQQSVLNIVATRKKR